MQSLKNHQDSPLFARVALILVATISFLLLLYWGKLILVPLFLAFLTAIFLYPLARFFEKKHFSKGMAAAISVVLLLLFIVIVSFFFSKQFLQFLKALPDLKAKLDVLVERVQNWMSENYNISKDSATQQLDSPLNKIVSLASNTIPFVLEWLVIIALFLFFTFYILFHRKLLESFIFSFFQKAYQKKIKEIAFELRSLINGYVKGLITEMVIFISLSFILLLIFGIKYALLMAVFAGVLNLIPYLGIYTATTINSLVILASTNLTQALEVAGVFIFMHVLDSNLILPKVVGRSVKMNPFVTLIAVVVGNLVWGVPGMFLFVPLTAIVRVLGEKLREFRSWAILIGEETNPKTPS